MVTCNEHFINVVFYSQVLLQLTAFMNKFTAHAANHFYVESVRQS